MVATDNSQGEVQSSFHSELHEQPANNELIPSLGRQSSIYSLTLDEFQNTLCEGGKNFGSMNMDEFLSSIWTAEENQAQAQAQTQTTNYNDMQFDLPSLSRQGSLTIPPPLYQKTVEEVWSDIHKTQREQAQQIMINGGNVGPSNGGSTQRQATFGEMTLEDFLVKAGVVREPGHPHSHPHPHPPTPPPPPAPPQAQPYGMVATPFVTRTVMPIGGVAAPSPTVPVYPGGNVYTKHSPGVYGKTIGAYGQVPGMTMGGSPVSPVSSDGLCGNPIDGNQYGLDLGGSRKRVIDGPVVGKVVERRQRRMIKNRESAARSRARKQAYTVELEAELNQLKEDNENLRHALMEMERKRKQEEMKMKMKTLNKVQKANEKLGVLRRSLSWP